MAKQSQNVAANAAKLTNKLTMKREIKFRGKRCLGGIWIFGDLLHNVETRQVAVAKCKRENNFAEFDVIPETVGQFTGLHDKTGKEIYEGDLIELPFGEKVAHEVIFRRGRFSLKRGDVSHALCIYHNDSYIVGNIHDNPELLKGSEL